MTASWSSLVRPWRDAEKKDGENAKEGKRERKRSKKDKDRKENEFDALRARGEAAAKKLVMEAETMRREKGADKDEKPKK
eukprot:405212-Pleurochrysis_carterae.AAC.1